MQIIQISHTTDYNLFGKLIGNRKEYPNHLKRLMETVKKRPALLPLNPILVDEEWNIIDGQHRKKVCQRLDLPVYFVQAKGLTLEDVQMLNSTRKPWTPLDVAMSFDEQGKKPYTIYLDLRHKYQFNHEIIMRYLSLDTWCTTEGFRDGKLQAPDVERTIELLDMLVDMGNFYTRNGFRNFAVAFCTVATSSFTTYDHKRMVKQLEKYNSRLVDHIAPFDYARNLEEIYNFHLGEAKQVRLV